MKYGYDKETQSLWAWDGDLHFKGKSGLIPEGAFISNDRDIDEMMGSAFLSGFTGAFIVLKSDGITEQYCLFGWESRVGYWKGQSVSQDDLKKMSVRMKICVCGSVVEDPGKMAKICYQFPTASIYACPVVDGLAAIGVLVRHMGPRKPYRVTLTSDNKDVIDAEFKAFDPKMDGDSMGQMADLVKQGIPVVNEVMRAVGVSPFYGKTIHNGSGKDGKNPMTFIIRMVDVDGFFPGVPISAKNYVATSVPVKMETSEQFREATGYNDQFANVFVSTDYIPGVSIFMRFYKSLSGKGVVFVSEQQDVKYGRIVPVFRSDRAYRVLRENYEQSHGFV